MERKVCAAPRLEIKALGGGSPGQLSGYASTFGNWDRVNERPIRGAFEKGLSDFLRDGFIAVAHDWSTLPIATVTGAREDDYGLFIEADFHSTPLAQEARTVAVERLERGKNVSLSIGYEVLADEFVDEGRLLKEVQLYEVSLVNVPANPLALVTGAKGSLLAGLPFGAHSEAVLAAAHEFVARAKDIESLRAKEGRVLSSANRAKLSDLKTSLADVLEAIDALLAATEPRADSEEVRKAVAEYLIRQAEADITQRRLNAWTS